MRMTLFSDASFCPTTKAAGWGAWAKRGDWIEGLIFGGAFKTSLNVSHEAELAAIANAMFVLDAEGHFVGVARLMIQTDNLRALGLIKANVPGTLVSDHAQGAPVPSLTNSSLSGAEQAALGVILSTSGKNALKLEVRHVRGHKAGPSRQWVNRQCDRVARRHMLSSREEKGQ